MNIQHSSRTDEWYTPLEYIVSIRRVLGQIDLDPASDKHGNARICATRYFTKEQDGLAAEWPINQAVYLNPPGSKKGNKSISALFWAKLMDYFAESKLKHAIFMGFSLEQLAVTQKYHDFKMTDFMLCIPERRIRFDKQNEVKKCPSHSNVIIYIPGQIDKTAKFIKEFSQYGAVK